MTKSRPSPYIASLASGLFCTGKLAELNPGSYHDANHAMYVAEVISTMAASRKREPARRVFLAQVALLHDADPRPCEPPTPAQVPRTLEWMLLNKEELLVKLSWTETAFATALAVIARTDFPFDNNPKANGTVFDGLSPYQLYRNMLVRLSPVARDHAFEDGQLLRFADQTANYCRDFITASESVDDLSDEMKNVGRSMTRWELNTAAFIDQLASDATWDCRIKRDLALSGRVFGQAELRHSLSPKMLSCLDANRDIFREERESRQAYG